MSPGPDAPRVLVVNVDLPFFPGQAGHEYLNTTGLARLARQVGLVSLLHTREQARRKDRLTEEGVALYLWKNPALARVGDAPAPAGPSRVRRVAARLYRIARAWPWRPTDTVVQDQQFANLARSIVEARRDGPWQALVVVQSSCARFADHLPRFPASVLVMHDVRALLYERQAAVAASPFRRLLARGEAWLYRRFERRYCQAYDLVLTVSSTDERWVRRHYRPRRLMTVPIPVDREYFAPMASVREAPARILFTGMMRHPPNEDAAGFFAREVLPRVQAAVPEAQFWIVGRDPSRAVRALGRLPGVVVTGYVADIRPYIAEATVVVVPLRFGSGMRNKILEAWAMGKCVVSTSLGAEGLDHEAGVDLVIADDVAAMAQRVVEALRDPGLRDRVRARGRTLVATRHDPARLARRYHEAIASVVRERRDEDGPMRVAIDLRWMRPGVAGGIESLSRAFLDHLLRLDAVNRYTVLLPAEARYDFDLRGRPNVRAVVADGLARRLRWLAWRAAARAHARLGLAYWRTPEVEALRDARALETDLALSIPGYIHPELWALDSVLVVPDIQHEYHPEFFSPGHLRERRRLYTESARHAVHICAISEFTRRTLIERLGIPPERITTTPLAADPGFHPGSPWRRDARRVPERYGLKAGEYLLFPSHTWPHKNHLGAVHALQVLREAYGLEPLLVCTGSPREAQGEVVAALRRLRLEGRVRFLGYCPAADMPGLYEGAAALFFPSLFEGFGIPLLEAMWCDCPVVASDTTSLPEIAGDAALLVDPRSPEALAHALSRVLTDDGLRRALVERGRRRVRDFSWWRFTTEVVRVLRRVDDERRG
jgi:glycosyltransferase involved in cell wall biosynthesis